MWVITEHRVWLAQTHLESNLYSVKDTGVQFHITNLNVCGYVLLSNEKFQVGFSLALRILYEVCCSSSCILTMRKQEDPRRALQLYKSAAQRGIHREPSFKAPSCRLGTTAGLPKMQTMPQWQDLALLCMNMQRWVRSVLENSCLI